MTIKKQPQIRFGGFGGDWEEKKLGEISSVERGKFSARPRNDPKFFGGETPFVQTGDVTNANLYLTKYTQTLNEAGLLVSKKFPEQTILMTIAANIGDNAITTFETACPDSLVAIQVNKENSDIFFVKYALDLKHDYLNGCATQNAQKNINLQVLNPLEIRLPEKPEQIAIGQFFRQLDEMLTLAEQKHAQTVQLKKAMLGKLFPISGSLQPQIRLKGFSGDWVERKLGDCFDYERPDKYIVKSDKYSDNFVTPVLTANKSFILGYTNETNTYNEKCIIFDDFTLESRFVDFSFMVKSSALKILTAKDGFDLFFGFCLLQATKFEILGHARHYISSVQNKTILMPSESEQTAIGKLFQTLDHTIALQAKEITQIKQLKSALLGKMFV